MKYKNKNMYNHFLAGFFSFSSSSELCDCSENIIYLSKTSLPFFYSELTSRTYSCSALILLSICTLAYLVPKMAPIHIAAIIVISISIVQIPILTICNIKLTQKILYTAWVDFPSTRQSAVTNNPVI